MSNRHVLEELGLSLPDYGGRELGAVLPASLAAVGAGDVVAHRDAEADRLRLGIPQAQHVIVVLLDGLGHLNLEARRGHAPFLRSHVQSVITAGYPTTTAASLGLFGTGQPSGQTGMTGYTARNPRTGTLANLISWKGAYAADEWQTQPSLLECAAFEGMNVTTLGEAKFAGSGLTHAVLRGGQFVGANKLADRIDVALAAARTPGLSYCYWGEIDAAGHKHGWMSEEWVAALEDADRELRSLADRLPTGAIMVLTADHGMVDVPGAPRWDVADDPVLDRDVELIAGEPRAVHVHIRPGVDPDVVAQRWREHLAGHAAVWTRAEARQDRLFGDLADSVADRVGDVVVAMADRSIVVDSRTQTPHSLKLVGMHGSLTPEELQVPLLVAEAN